MHYFPKLELNDLVEHYAVSAVLYFNSSELSYFMIAHTINSHGIHSVTLQPTSWIRVRSYMFLEGPVSCKNQLSYRNLQALKEYFVAGLFLGRNSAVFYYIKSRIIGFNTQPLTNPSI